MVNIWKNIHLSFDSTSLFTERKYCGGFGQAIECAAYLDSSDEISIMALIIGKHPQTSTQLVTAIKI